jgi:hypothetical protein
MRLPGLAIAILLSGLTVFSCKSSGPVPVRETIDLLTPPVPEAPRAERVEFEDREGGLWLSYDNYRALERNIIALREYAAHLEIVIGFYRGDEWQHEKQNPAQH